MSNAMRFGKRSLAGVAAGALALGMLTIASAPAASAKPSIKPKASLTGTVSPVRVTFTGTTLDTVPLAQISWTSSAALSNTDTIAVNLVNAPSPSATLGIGVGQNVGVASAWTGSVFTTPAANETLANPETSFAVGTLGPTAAGQTARISIAASQAGTYTGTLTSNSTTTCNTASASITGGGVCDSVAFSFTTTGAVASMTLTPTSASSSTSGVTPMTVTLKDAAGNNTQPLTVDGVTVSNNAGTTPVAVTTSNSAYSGAAPASPPATSLFDGVAVSNFTAPAAAGTYTVTATPSGTLPGAGVTTQNSTISVSGTVAGTPVSTMSITVPADADNTGTQPSARAAEVPAGTSAVTLTVTGTAATTYRFAAYSYAASGTPATGTINGVTAGTSVGTATALVNVTTNASGIGTAAFTLGGNLVASGSQIRISQVTAANAEITSPNTATMTVTQSTPALSATLSETTPTGNIVQALGTPTPVTVTVVDQFGDPIPNATVRAFRGSYTGTLLSSGVTNASGQASVTVSNLSTLAAGGSEQYFFTAAPFGASAVNITSGTLTVLYTASGAVTSMSVTVTGGATTPILNTTTSIATLPFINVPSTGIVTGTATGVYTVATGAGTAGGNFVQFNAAPTPANMVTVTVPEGVKVSTTAPSATTLWSAGSQSVVAASSQAVYVWATKTGTHDIRFTSGAITTTAKIQVATPTTAAYNIAVTPAARTIEAGAFSTVTMTVTDVFGNPVPGITGSSNSGVLASATGEVLLSGLTSSNVVSTGANGTASITLIAGKPGTGTITFGPSGGTTNVATAWGAGYTPPVGAPAPVTSAAVAVVVTDTPDRSITISGTRGTVSGKSGIIIDGVTDGIENGKTVTPFIRFPGETTFTAGSARPAISGDEFTWQRKTGKRVTVYVELSDDASIRSNRVTIQAS